jgi:hypothetical protein
MKIMANEKKDFKQVIVKKYNKALFKLFKPVKVQMATIDDPVIRNLYKRMMIDAQETFEQNGYVVMNYDVKVGADGNRIQKGKTKTDTAEREDRKERIRPEDNRPLKIK